jgi:hypothetical protein
MGSDLLRRACVRLFTLLRRGSAETVGLGSAVERRLRLENGQLKLALAEATVQLRVWQKGAEYVEEVPSKTSRP